MTIHSPLILVAVAIMAVLVFAQVLAAVRHSRLFGQRTSVVVAVCVTLLGMIGLASHGRAGGRFLIEIDALLLPYLALFLCLVLLALARWLWPRGTGVRPRRPTTWSLGDADRTVRGAAEFSLEDIKTVTRGHVDTGRSLVRRPGDLVRTEREGEVPSPVTRQTTGPKKDNGSIVR